MQFGKIGLKFVEWCFVNYFSRNSHGKQGRFFWEPPIFPNRLFDSGWVFPDDGDRPKGVPIGISETSDNVVRDFLGTLELGGQYEKSLFVAGRDRRDRVHE